MEFESEKMMIRGRKINAEVELWDCGGDKRYEIHINARNSANVGGFSTQISPRPNRTETCWPIFAQQVNGIIFVFNSGVESHVKYIERVHTHFVRKLGLLRVRKPKNSFLSRNHVNAYI